MYEATLNFSICQINVHLSKEMCHLDLVRPVGMCGNILSMQIFNKKPIISTYSISDTLDHCDIKILCSITKCMRLQIHCTSIIDVISVLKDKSRCHSSIPVTKTTTTPTQIKPQPPEEWILRCRIMKPTLGIPEESYHS